MKLHASFFSPNSRKCIATARYLGADVELVERSFSTGELKSDEFLEINPNGALPALVDGDFNLWESSAIVQYLGDKSGNTTFMPQGITKRAEVNRWMFWGQLHFGRWLNVVSFQRVLKSRFGLGEPDEAVVEEALGRFAGYAKTLNAHLADRLFLLGDDLSGADFVVAAPLTYAQLAKVPVDAYPNIVSWLARLEEIPAWRDSGPKLDG